MKNDSQQGRHAVQQQYDRREIQNHNQENFLDKTQPTTLTTAAATDANDDDDDDDDTGNQNLRGD
jgi:hypothetical protein